MSKKLLLAVFILFAFSQSSFSQNYNFDWSSSFVWAAGTTSKTASNVNGSGINIAVSFVNSQAGSYQNSSPAIGGNVGAVNWMLPGTTANGGMVLYVDWSNTQKNVTGTITFSSPVANPTFYVGDIDKSAASTTGSTDYIDQVTVTGTTPSATTLAASTSKFNSGSTILLQPGGGAVYADPASGHGGNAGTNTTSGAAQDGTALYSIVGTVSSITIVYNNFNSSSGVNPSGQAVDIGDIAFTKTVAISGTVYGDVNGNQAKDGGETGIEPVALFVNAVDVATGIVIGTAAVNSDGTYSLPTIASNANVKLVLSTAAAALGATAAPVTATISGYKNTSALTLTAASTGTAGLTGQDFGLDALPVPASNATGGQLNPGGTINFTVPAATFGAVDPDGGTIGSIRIISLPSHVTSVTINGTTYTSINFPVGGVTIPTNAAGLPTQAITVDPVDGLVNVGISFKATDNAGNESTATGTATVVFSAILPLKLISFSGAVTNGHADLQWQTENELNVQGYVVEKSLDGINFMAAGNVTATNDINAQQYHFTDPVAGNGTTFYRLRMTDKDGRATYSNVLKLGSATANNISGLATRFSDKISFQYTAAVAQPLQLVLIDANGRVEKTVKQGVAAGTNTVSITGLQNLASGNYFLKIVAADNFLQVLKLTKTL